MTQFRKLHLPIPPAPPAPLPPMQSHNGLPDLPVYSSMTQMAAHSGIPLERIKRAKEMGCNFTGTGKTYALRQFLEWESVNMPNARAVDGEQPVLSDREEKALHLRQSRLDMEKEARVRDGELAERDWLEKEITEKFILPLSAAFNDAPDSLSVRCNPENPALAREAIQGWCEGCKRQLRETINYKEPEK